VVTVHDGRFVRCEGPFFVYVFSTESPLIVMDDAPAEVEIGGQKHSGQVVSAQGSEVAVGIENDCGKSIAEARLITNLWYLLEALRKRYKEVLDGERSFDTRLPQCVFGFTTARIGREQGELGLPVSTTPPDTDQQEAIRKALASDVSFIWGPPGTGKTTTIGFLLAALVNRGLRVLMASHTNVATNNAIASVAKLLEHSADYQGGKFLRYGSVGESDLPDKFPMVVPERVAAALGQHLMDRLAQLRAETANAREQLSNVKELLALLSHAQESRRKANELQANAQRAEAAIATAKQDDQRISAQLQEAQEKSAYANAAGTIKRLLLGLNPTKLQAEMGRIQGQLTIAQNTVAASTNRHRQIIDAANQAAMLASQLEADSQKRLERGRTSPATLSEYLRKLNAENDRLNAECRAVEKELETIRDNVLRDAKIIATTLTKATITKQFDDQKFDVLVVDEASMAPLPNLYFAATRASQKVVVVGDFRQLPPISIGDTEMTREWLAREIFHQAGIQRAVDDGRDEPRLARLSEQYRMHPSISAISNKIIYRGEQHDHLDPDALRKIADVLHESRLGKAPVILYDTSSTDPWSCRLDQGGRYNLYSAVLTAELARRAAATAKIDRVGVITPYRHQARLIKMIIGDTDDALKHLNVSTVHRFQGMEKDVILFDVAEGPMPRYGPAPQVDGTELSSGAAKLINVAITRAQAQLAVVANVEYLFSKLGSGAILLKVLSEILEEGEVVDSQEIIDTYFCEDFERWAMLLDPHNDSIDPNASALYTERNFYAAFFADLRKALSEIVIVSPFLTAARTHQFFNLFRSKIAEGIEIRVFTKPLGEQRGNMLRQAEEVLAALKNMGVQVVERSGMHQKFAFVDRKIAWEGSLNILSQRDGQSTEHMRRLPFAGTCEELIEMHKLGSDTEVAPGTRRPIQTDRKCQKCGSTTVLVRGPHGVFVGCMDYPKCDSCYSIRRGDKIGTDVICAGKAGVACGRSMVAVLGRFGVYLKCSDPECQGTRNIP